MDCGGINIKDSDYFKFFDGCVWIFWKVGAREGWLGIDVGGSSWED